MKYTRVCVTDLDGTLLNSEHRIAPANLAALCSLGGQSVCRVAATGRSLYSLKKVLSTDAPFDYVIFSTGAGIMNWRTQQIMLARLLSKEEALSAFKTLLSLKEDFFLHAPIPDNHLFIAVEARGLPDFNRRLGVYQEFGRFWNRRFPLPWEEATQLLVIAQEQDEALYYKLVKLFKNLRVIRTTSPFDHRSLWLEIFSPEVSKGSAVQYLLDLFGFPAGQLMVVGNDFNDLDMLRLTPHSYVTSNAPLELRRSHKVVSAHDDGGFAEAVSLWLDQFGK